MLPTMLSNRSRYDAISTPSLMPGLPHFLRLIAGCYATSQDQGCGCPSGNIPLPGVPNFNGYKGMMGANVYEGSVICRQSGILQT